jgi:carbon monoxide dehydrogenase subunit G
MISLGLNLIVHKPVGIVWRFLNNIEAMASCVPTMAKYRLIDDDTLSCDLRLKLGLIPLESKAEVKITRREENRCLEIEGRTEAGDSLKRFGKLKRDTVTHLKIAIGFEQVGPKETLIYFRLQAQAKGQLKRVYDSIIKGQREKMEDQFIANLDVGLGVKAFVQDHEQDSHRRVCM